jgi:hypothetical protein
VEPTETIEAEDVVGRKTDILLLESALLMQSNVGILWGEPGIGKTALMRSVSEWWSKTHLIRNRGLAHHGPKLVSLGTTRRSTWTAWPSLSMATPWP